MVDTSVLDAVLDSWDRNNIVMRNLLGAIPERGLEARASDSSPSVAQQFMHLLHERMISVYEEAPEFAAKVPEDEWSTEHDRGKIRTLLDESAAVVRSAVQSRVLEGRPLELNYVHPTHLIQLLLWHEAYHHGQIKLTLKLAGRPISDDIAGPLTWDVLRGRRLQ